MEKADRFRKQLEFVRELDKLKTVFRKTYLLDATRTENDAEHSWQIAMMALLFQEYAEEQAIDLLTVVTTLLLHDLVEIDAGDTYIYDPESRKTQAAREEAAAIRIFGILPPEQRDQFTALWRDFEDGRTKEARFARAIDRFQPFLHNYLTEGKTWREHHVRAESVREVIATIKDGSCFLWEYAEKLVSEAIRKGYLSD